jgi:predicted alpha-1,2-mannosidase
MPTLSITARLFSTLLPLGIAISSGHAQAPRPVDFVNPMVGTDDHGHTYPGAEMPFGFVQLSPDTHTDDWDGCSGYHYRDTTIQGFSHTHLSGTGAGCLGDILLMPTVGAVHLNAGTPGDGYVSRFSHAEEVAKPGYYKVFLQDPKVTVELTATTRVGLHRYTFTQSGQSHIVIDLMHGIQNDAYDTQLKVVNGTTLVGYRKSRGWGGERGVYFEMQFSKPFDSIGFEENGKRLSGDAQEARGKVKAFVNYSTEANEQIEVKVALSATGIEGAEKNLRAELPGWDFAATRQAASDSWNRELGNVIVQSKDPHVKNTFYTNLYESYQAPALFNDVDGSYWGTDHKVHANGGFQNYTTFSLWDTYRALHPMLTILKPERVSDLVRSLLAEYDQSGLHTTPIWPLWGNETFCMVGHHSIPVIVDAYLKGVKGFDPEKAYLAMRDTVMQDGDGLKDYRTIGFVVSARGQQATSKTLEYAYDDWCLARMAETLGHTADAEMFYRRSGNYRNLFDRSTGFMRGRKADGLWRVPIDTHGMVGDEYTEADPWQYAFFVQHDIPGLAQAFGGDKPFIAKLDQLFVEDSTIHTGIPDISGLIGQYSQGDEQCHHVAYLYDYVGEPWKTQYRARDVMSKFYNDTPKGQCGNVDCGQMSAWYVLSALGFYPVNPVSGVYMIGSPLIDKATISLPGGKTFTIAAENNSARNVYIQSIRLNGKKIDRVWFTHRELTAGGSLEFVMGPNPNKTLGVALASRAKSGMPSGLNLAVLPRPSALQPAPKPIALTLPIRVVLGSDDPVGDFVPDPNLSEGGVNSDDVAVDTHAPGAGPEGIYKSERYASDLTYRYHVPAGTYVVRLHFAEIFDNGAGMRKEDVALNGASVLSDFDIFKAAGGKDKAIVRTFSGVRPDPSGYIAIRVSASKDSPDQNAKLCAIEILPE